MNNQKGVQKAKRICKWVAIVGVVIFAATAVMDKIPGIFELVHPAAILMAGAVGFTGASFGGMGWLLVRLSFKQNTKEVL